METFVESAMIDITVICACCYPVMGIHDKCHTERHVTPPLPVPLVTLLLSTCPMLHNTNVLKQYKSILDRKYLLHPV